MKRAEHGVARDERCCTRLRARPGATQTPTAPGSSTSTPSARAGPGSRVRGASPRGSLDRQGRAIGSGTRASHASQRSSRRSQRHFRTLSARQGRVRRRAHGCCRSGPARAGASRSRSPRRGRRLAVAWLRDRAWRRRAVLSAYNMKALGVASSSPRSARELRWSDERSLHAGCGAPPCRARQSCRTPRDEVFCVPQRAEYIHPAAADAVEPSRCHARGAPARGRRRSERGIAGSADDATDVARRAEGRGRSSARPAIHHRSCKPAWYSSPTTRQACYRRSIGTCRGRDPGADAVERLEVAFEKHRPDALAHVARARGQSTGVRAHSC